MSRLLPEMLPITLDLKSPDIPLYAFVDIKCMAVGAHLNAVGGAHVGRDTGNFSIAIDAPDLARGLRPTSIVRPK
jgi:hypothetical protein